MIYRTMFIMSYKKSARWRPLLVFCDFKLIVDTYNKSLSFFLFLFVSLFHFFYTQTHIHI